VIVTILFFVQLYSLLFFFQRLGVPCEVQHDGMTISGPAFTYLGLLNSAYYFLASFLVTLAFLQFLFILQCPR
jgi:hypothetical protein